MFSTAPRKRLYESMNRFDQTPEFKKELKKLSKKFQSLGTDLKTFEAVITNKPTGIGTSFTIIHATETVKIVKARLACKTLRNTSLRIIYAFREDTITFMYIELYFKGDKPNEDQVRVDNYLEKMDKTLKKNKFVCIC